MANDRMNRFFKGETLDRLPLIEWAPWWDLTLKQWHEEGLDEKIDFWDVAEKAFGIDKMVQIALSNISDNHPTFKSHGIINNEEEYEKLLPYLYQEKEIDKFIEKAKDYLNDDKTVLWFTFTGFFWFPRVLFGIEDHLYSFYDYSELYHRICQDMSDFYIRAIDKIFKVLKPNFITFAEDMSYNLGPMISKDVFDEFIRPYYDKVIPAFHKHDVKVIIDSDGDVTKMIPWFIESNADGLLPLERQAGVDINFLTDTYPDFYFIGGFDKMVMKHGEAAIRTEFQRILPAIKRNHYIPSVDHQTPPGVTMENYKIYCKLLREYLSNDTI